MNTTPDISGIKLGRLEMLAICGSRGHEGVVWLCQCECGMMCFAYSRYILAGKIRSCRKCCRLRMDRKPVTRIEGRTLLVRNEFGYYETYEPKQHGKRSYESKRMDDDQKPFSMVKEIKQQRRKLERSISVGDRIKYKVAGGIGQASGVVLSKGESAVVVSTKHGTGRKVVKNSLIVCKVQNG